MFKKGVGVDALEMLGGLLRGGGSSSGSAQGGGLGGKILGDLLKAGTESAACKAAPSSAPRRGSVSHQPVDIQAEARRLEEMLGVAAGGRREAGRVDVSVSSSKPASSGASAPAKGAKAIQESPAGRPASKDQAEAMVLARAMINAAKADGKLDAQEQQFILSRVSNDSETIQFLQQELSRPLDVREFTWSVPLGMEVQVYTLSLATITVDSEAEIRYLKELAHGLRLAPDLCNEIHSRYGAKPIF